MQYALMWPVLLPLVSPVVAALIAAFVPLWVNSRLDRQKADFDSRLARQKAEFDHVAERHRTEYSWLYTERAKAMLNIYARLIDADQTFVKAARVIPQAPTERTALMKKLEDAVIAFRAAYRPNRILFNLQLAGKLDAVDATYEKIRVEALASVVAAALDRVASGKPIDDIQLRWDEPQTKAIIQDLEAAFRKYYGGGLEAGAP